MTELHKRNSEFAEEFEILCQLQHLHTGIAQKDNRNMFDLLGQIHPLSIRSYESDQEHNGWIVPHHYDVKKAEIRFRGKTIFDGRKHVLAVAGASASFRGTISKAELDEHVFF